MCTLTFLPGLPGGGYLLASNRDESVRRGEALPPYLRQVGDRLVMAPADRDAGGTWIGADDRGHCLAILNGDMPAAAPPPDQPVSRGLLVRELLDDPRPQAVRATLAARHDAGRLPYRPFKLLAAAPGADAGSDAGPDAGDAWLLRAEWDGRSLAFSEQRGAVCIVSSTLQPREAAEARGAAFAAWLAELPPPGTPRRLVALAELQQRFHASHAPDAPRGGPLTVCMHREEARTVSSVQVCVTAREVSMRYQPGWPCEAQPAQLTWLPRRDAAGAALSA